jgi:hypothetical protein
LILDGSRRRKRRLCFGWRIKIPLDAKGYKSKKRTPYKIFLFFLHFVKSTAEALGRQNRKILQYAPIREISC